ncbi:MAG: hypothetical protein LBM93_00255, partial [Oscillospiraceae bacterium]|nr:hypothetical protein [Oscillospiraceae bacterium]
MYNNELQNLIDTGKQIPRGVTQKCSDWVSDVEVYLKNNKVLSKDAENYISGLRYHGNVFNYLPNLVSYLRQQNRIPQRPNITKSMQIFVAMWFNEEMENIYDNV